MESGPSTAQSSSSSLAKPQHTPSPSITAPGVSLSRAVPEFAPKTRNVVKITTPAGIPVDLDKIRREAQVKAAASAAGMVPETDESKRLKMQEEERWLVREAKAKARKEAKKQKKDKDKKVKEVSKQKTKEMAGANEMAANDNQSGSSTSSSAPSTSA